MSRLRCLLAALAVSASVTAGVTVGDSILSSGVYRSFLVYLPTTYSAGANAPLILNLHGYTSDAYDERDYTDFMPIADTAGFIMAYPQGTGASAYWNAGIVTGAPFDAQFLNDLVDTLLARYSIDNDRVYCCGFSNGGIMSYFQACSARGRFAAIASVSGTMFSNWFGTCKPSAAVPVMEIHGDQDATVPYGGQSFFMPVDTVVMRWVRLNGCSQTPSVTNLPDAVPGDNTTAKHYVYTGGVDGSTVELYKISGGSHSWPGSVQVFINTCEDFSASQEIWRFFRKYRRSQFVTPTTVAEYDSAAGAWYRYYRATLTVTGQGAFNIYSAEGKLMSSGIAPMVMDLSWWPAGLYVLRSEGINRAVKLIVE